MYSATHAQRMRNRRTRARALAVAEATCYALTGVALATGVFNLLYWYIVR